MAHGPSPFGVPRRDQGHDYFADEEFDSAQASAPTQRLTPEELARASSAIDHASEEDMEAHLERIQASRPLRRAAQRARTRTRWWLVALAVVSGLAVVAACGAGAFIVLKESETTPETQREQASDDAQQAESTEDGVEAPDVVDPIELRDTDPEPLTVAELFETPTITPTEAAGAYEVVATDELSDCAEAGLDDLADLLAEADCTQAVRATLVTPDGDHAATAGVLNLADADEADELWEAIDSGVKGFAVLRADDGPEELGRAATILGYNKYGHYLMYVVVGRTDGADLEEADDAVMTVVNDIVDVWLVDRLLPRRAVE